MQTATIGGVTFQEENDRLVLRVSWRGVLAASWNHIIILVMLLSLLFYFFMQHNAQRYSLFLTMLSLLTLLNLGLFTHFVWRCRTPVILDRGTRSVVRGGRHLCSFGDIVSLVPAQSVYMGVKLWHIMLHVTGFAQLFLLTLPNVATEREAVHKIAGYLGAQPAPVGNRFHGPGKLAPLLEGTYRIPLAKSQYVWLSGLIVGFGVALVVGLGLYVGMHGQWNELLQSKGGTGKNGFIQLAVLMVGGLFVVLAFVSGLKTVVLVSAEGIALEKWGRRQWQVPWSDYDGWRWEENGKGQKVALRFLSMTGSEHPIRVPWFAQGLTETTDNLFEPIVAVLRERAPGKGNVLG